MKRMCAGGIPAPACQRNNVTPPVIQSAAKSGVRRELLRGALDDKPFPLAVESVEVNDQLKLLTVAASTTPAEAACPLCQEPSQRVHSRYTRTLAGLPCCGQRVQWLMQVRRFRCLNASCKRKLFTERLPI